MNYLYRQSTVSNPVDSVLILEGHVLLHHHSTIKIFDHSLKLLRKKHFYEKIIGIKRISERAFAILFRGDKLVQCDVDFNPLALRMVHGNSFDEFNGFVVVYDTSTAQFFHAKEAEIYDMDLPSIGIPRAAFICFMNHYIPFLLITSGDDNQSKCTVVNLDNPPIKMEEFAILDNVVCIKSTEKFIVFANRNFIQIRYQRRSFVIYLNSNIKPGLLSSAIRNGTVAQSFDSSEESKEIFLENPFIFFLGDVMFVLNGNGEMFSIEIQIETRRSMDVKISFRGRLARPSSLDCVDDLLCVGSRQDSTTLYRLPSLEVIGVVENIGVITSLPTHNSVLATGNRVFKTARVVNLCICKKLKIDVKVSRMVADSEGIVIFSPNKTFKLNADFELAEVNNNKYDASETTSGGYQFIFDRNKSLAVHADGKSIGVLLDVSVWSFSSGILVFVRNGTFEAIELSTLRPLFYSSDILKFGNDIRCGGIFVGKDLEGVVLDNPASAEDRLEASNVVLEVKTATSSNNTVYFIFRTARQLYIYRFIQNKLVKIFIDRPIIFEGEGLCLFDVPPGLYCRSRIPYFVVFAEDVYFYEVSLKLADPVAANGWIYGMSKGQILKCKVEGGSDPIYTEEMMLWPQYSLEPCISSVKTVTARNKHDKVEVFEDYRELDAIKIIISMDDCHILAIASVVPFFYTPFIPMVYMTSGTEQTPQSEPINKEEASRVNDRPSLHSRTLQYSIELRSLEFKLIMTAKMEENEFISDMKIMFGSFLVVCTSFLEGENKMAKGKLSVYALVNIVPDPQNPHIIKKLKLICTEVFKSPCIRCQEVRSLIAVCVGTRLMIYDFNENTGLLAVGRNEVALLCTSLFATKNLIALSDIHNGVYFFFMRPRNPLRLHLLSRSSSFKNCRFVGGIDSPIAESDWLKFSIIGVSSTGSMRIFTYSPQHPASNNGHRLIMRAEIATCLDYPLYYAAVGQPSSYEFTFSSSNVLGTVATTRECKIHAVQQCISLFVDNSCGINLRNYLETEEYVNLECKSVISERVLLEFFYMSTELQANVCDILKLNYLSIVEAIEECFMGMHARRP